MTDARGHLLTGRDGAGAVGHGWDSAALTPLPLVRGRAPRSGTEVVLPADLASGASVHLGDRIRVATATTRAAFTVTGIVATLPGRHLTREAPVFFRGDVARRISGLGDRADLIAVVLRPGADAHRRRDAHSQCIAVAAICGC